ncbi:MAG: tRNA (N(6)-L-threonylcarbamoyladenosine(37)-C(2))-methylthiotransferase MtaB [Phycisphaerales bacterium]|jgi:threonylcarbamoyladenosine tRNA methylthiotransferase MtaB|nr:tRNA (N(6)-L-threonylcarbamoyladenosine(37)-C(2))-methylthiotransferase MtaB [Phycisphaerales bacterium]
MIKFSITTLGCKVNQYDGVALATKLKQSGLLQSEPHEQNDLVIVNTCCVTSTAMRKSRQTIRKLLRNNTDATILVTGCYSDYDAKAIAQMLTSLGVKKNNLHVAGHHSNLSDVIDQIIASLQTNKFEAQQQIESTESTEQTESAKSTKLKTDPGGDRDSIRARRNIAVKRKAGGTREIGGIKVFPNHQRAFVKVQDGCDAFCSYCIVPYTRAVVWSKTIQQVRDECTDLVNSGHKEIVLAGVFLGAFGRETSRRNRWSDAKSTLPQLLSEIAAIDGLWRVRLSSLEPGDLSDELLEVYRTNPTVAPHFHLPLQSGSQNILEKMNRQYTAQEFRQTIDRVKNALDTPAITTDIIVGFPGETDEDFAQTLEMARYAGFSKIHTFPFSALEGTVAWEHRNETPRGEIVKARIAQLGQLEAEMADAFRKKLVGRRLEALVESTRPEPDVRQAMTDRYVTVRFKPPQNAKLTGKVVALDIDDIWSGGLYCHSEASVLQ